MSVRQTLVVAILLLGATVAMLRESGPAVLAFTGPAANGVPSAQAYSIELRGGSTTGTNNGSVLSRLAPGRYTLGGGAYPVTSNATIPKGVVLDIRPGSSLSVSRGVKVTFNGTIDHDVFTRIFAGEGKVVGLRFNRPEWWGAQNNYGYTAGRDDSGAINAAIASAVSLVSSYEGDRPKVVLTGEYYVCHQVDAYINTYTSLEIAGVSGNPSAGGTINICPMFAGASYSGRGASSNGVLNIHGSPAGLIPDLFFHDFSINNGNGASGLDAAIVFNPEGNPSGSTNYSLGCLKLQAMQDIFIGGFPVGWHVTNTRCLHFLRDVVSNKAAADSIGWVMEAAGPGSFVGDMEFDHVQTDTCRNHEASKCKGTGGMAFRAGDPGAGFAGVRIQGIFYGSNTGLSFQVSGGATAGDVWVNPGTQFDGNFGRAIDVQASGQVRNAAGTVQPVAYTFADFHASHIYHTGGPAPGNVAHVYAARDGARLTGVLDDDNWYGGTSGSIVYLSNVWGCHVSGNTILHAFTAMPAIEIAGNSHACSFVGNNVVASADSGGTATMSSIVQLDRGVSYMATSANMGTGVSNAATSFVVDNSGNRSTNSIH